MIVCLKRQKKRKIILLQAKKSSKLFPSLTSRQITIKCMRPPPAYTRSNKYFENRPTVGGEIGKHT